MKVSISVFSLLFSSVVAGVSVSDRGSDASVIVGNYIVIYNGDVTSSQRSKHEGEVHGKAKGRNKKGVFQLYDIPAAGKNGTAFTGYAVEIDDADLPLITSSPLVAYVEKDAVVTRTATPHPQPKAQSKSDPKKNLPRRPGPNPSLKDGRFARYSRDERLNPATAPALEKRAITTQKTAPWGLAKMSNCQGNDAGRQQYFRNPTFAYDSTAGDKVRVYIVDSGILTGHSEFGGRAVWGANFITGSPNTDEFGSGTHTAGIVAGKTYGIAKKAIPVAVKVFNSNGIGTTAQVIAGIQWALLDTISKNIPTKSVLLIADVEAVSTAMNQLILTCINTYGLTTVVPAGDDNNDATQYSPASSFAISVTATIGDLSKPWWANWGSWVDMSAPGDMIVSAWRDSTSATALLSGSVPAAAFVAGLAAYTIKKDAIVGHSSVRSKLMNFYVTPYGFDPMLHTVPNNVACLNPF